MRVKDRFRDDEKETDEQITWQKAIARDEMWDTEVKHYLFECDECEEVTKHEMHHQGDEEYTAICTHCRNSMNLIKK
jgi:predicted SprT family Zn-dependent metalloprotease